MIPETRGWLLVLRLGLLLGAAGWGVSVYFAMAPWHIAVAQLQTMGASHIEYQPLLDYWLRMAATVFACIGLGAAMAFVRPFSFEGWIRMLGPFHGMVGCVLAMAAWHNQLDPRLHPTFIPDIVFCFLTSALIQVPLYQARRVARMRAV